MARDERGELDRAARQSARGVEAACPVEQPFLADTVQLELRFHKDLEPYQQLVDVDRGGEHVPGAGAKGRQLLGPSQYPSTEHDNGGRQGSSVQRQAEGVIRGGQPGAEEDGVGPVRLGDVGGVTRVAGGHDAKATPE